MAGLSLSNRKIRGGKAVQNSPGRLRGGKGCLEILEPAISGKVNYTPDLTKTEVAPPLPEQAAHKIEKGG
jgi:hypothetical protein